VTCPRAVQWMGVTGPFCLTASGESWARAVGEGTHFLIPWLQKPYIYDVRTRPRSITSVTGTKGEPTLPFPFLCSLTAGCVMRTAIARSITFVTGTQVRGRAPTPCISFCSAFAAVSTVAAVAVDAVGVCAQTCKW